MKLYKIDLCDDDIDNIECSLSFCNRKMNDLLNSINYKKDMRIAIIETIHHNEILINYLESFRNDDTEV